jgi:hypothetical protein
MSESLSRNFDLQPMDDGSFYRTTNTPDLMQRESLISRGDRDSLLFQAELVSVVHGTLDPDGAPATLIVTDFKFVSLTKSRRYKSAVISYRFSGRDSSSPDPVVYNIAPEGSLSLSRSVEGSVAGPSSANVGVNATLGYSWDLAETTEKTGQARVAGMKRIEQRNYGQDNTAVWTLVESGDEKSGIPTFLRTAILLRREESKANEPFQAIIEVKATVDLAYSLRRVFSATPKDDQVIFDPTKGSIGSGNFDGKKLAKINLKDLSMVMTTTTLQESQIGEGLKGKVACLQDCTTPTDKMSKVNFYKSLGSYFTNHKAALQMILNKVAEKMLSLP